MFRLLTGVLLLLLGLTCNAGTTLAAGSHESLDGLTRRLMTLNVEHQQGDAAGRASILGALVSVAAAREQQLAALIANHPDAVLRHAVSATMRAALSTAVQAHVEEELTTDGELEVLHEDGGPNGGRYHYFVNRPEGRLALHFAADPPVLQTGDRVRVSGVRVQQAMALGSGSSNVMLQAAAALPNTFGPQKTAVILVNYQDKPTATWMTPAQAHAIVFAADNPASVTNFYKEASYGQTWLVGEVYGVYTIPLNSGGCNYGAIGSYAKAAAKAQVGATKMGEYERLVYVFPPSPCLWSGFGTVGGSPSQAWFNGGLSTGLVSHEMGHNFGLMHSHALQCDGASVCSNGVVFEYGDEFDVMGYGWRSMHFNAAQKEQLGWLNHHDSPPITTVQASGTYTIAPYETAGSQPRALRVQTSSGDWYYMEYRQALGFDASSLIGNSNVTNGVLVHLWSHNQSADRISLLNMRPNAGNWTYPALEVGSTFSDPVSGITISPVWADDTLGVNVSIGGGGGSSCVRKNPTVKVSPAHQKATAGALVSYTVLVTNNDSGCEASTFNQQATVPAGWAASFAASALNIAAGASAPTVLKVTSPASAAAGSYAVSPKSHNAVAPTNVASTTATYDVGSGGPAGPFVDDFNRADSDTLGNGWTSVSGSLAIQGNRAANQPAGAAHMAVRPGLVGATQTVAASFASLGSAAPEFGLLARYQNAGNYYTCYRRTGGTSVLRISKVVGSVETVLGSVAVANPRKGGSFTLGCQVQGTALKLTLNGASKLTVSDSTLGTGSVGLSMRYRGANTASATPSWADDFSADVH